MTKTRLQNKIATMVDTTQLLIDEKLEAKVITKAQAVELRAKSLRAIYDTLDAFHGSLLGQIKRLTEPPITREQVVANRKALKGKLF